MYIYIHTHTDTILHAHLYTLKQKDRQPRARFAKYIYIMESGEYVCLAGLLYCSRRELPSVKSQRVVLRGVVARPCTLDARSVIWPVS
jgi:hypothetical protein